MGRKDGKDMEIITTGNGKENWSVGCLVSLSILEDPE